MRTETITLIVKYKDCEETGSRNYSFDELRELFEEKVKELETDAEMRQDAWNDKQRDYALDSMT